MIQRKQTLFLLAGLVCLAFLFAPSVSLATIEGTVLEERVSGSAMLEDGVFNITDHIILMLLALLGILFSFITILYFKNRSVQMRLCRFIIIATILMILLGGWFFYQNLLLIPVGTEVHIEYGILLPPAVIVFIIFAMRFINRDEKLVRSSDRLR